MEGPPIWPPIPTLPGDIDRLTGSFDEIWLLEEDEEEMGTAPGASG